ncbi:tripartite tricarboxylate transporter TctB family protein [Thioclava sp. SK-1]|uniref:tripartite tricarboxylate transporter TctB family protein n=1 Tax=Thioclava sp. SK-1 TaxID=1889770 RepID=UPI00159F210F|nr:tripartite tricarboxylate transporter TctB family protein [Thioclava sp. SK-1]
MPAHNPRALIPLLIACSLALFAIGWSFTFKDVPPFLIRGFQPAAFPRLISGLILLLSVLAFIELKHHEFRLEDAQLEPLAPAFWRSLLMLAGFAALLGLGDLLFALMVATAGVSFIWGERRVLVLIGLGVVAPVLVFVLFDQLFEVRFPRGFLLDLYYR